MLGDDLLCISPTLPHLAWKSLHIPWEPVAPPCITGSFNLVSFEIRSHAEQAGLELNMMLRMTLNS